MNEAIGYAIHDFLPVVWGTQISLAFLYAFLVIFWGSWRFCKPRRIVSTKETQV